VPRDLAPFIHMYPLLKTYLFLTTSLLNLPHKTSLDCTINPQTIFWTKDTALQRAAAG